ncbi:MAG: hypothetical protein Q9227_008559 [Pyrenula ochraceoflavens]
MSNRPLPPSAANNHEPRDYYSTDDPSRPTASTIPTLTPYLGLRARLSQIWINRWTILLLLVLARTLIAIAGLKDDLGSARTQALSACSDVESVGSAMASMPHYMSQGVNQLTATGVEKAVNGLMDMSLMTITGVEELVVFVINMMTSTYLCLITLAVSGSLHVALQVAKDAEAFLNKTISNIGHDMANTVSGFQNDWNKFLGTLNSGLTSITGHGIKPPSLDLNASMTALNDITLPPTLNEGLDKLNSSIPTFAQVNNFTQTALRFPFEMVKGLVNESMHTFQFNRSLFPVPQKEKLTFCSDDNGINSFFDELLALALEARKIAVVVLLILALLACAFMAWREIKRYRTMQERGQLVRSDAYDPMDVVYIVSRPYTATAGIKVASKFQATRRQLLTRWVIAYATSTPALFVLSLGIAGLFSCLCQYILLKSVEKEVPALTNQVANFTDKVVRSLNNASEQWAIGTNHAISHTNAEINDKMFSWVNISTHAVNDTLNTFVNEMTKVLNDTFGGTVLYDPITEVLNCLVTMKVVGIEKGLTWVSDHAHIDFPLLPNDTFSLGAVAKVADENSGNPSVSAQSPSGMSDLLASPGSSTTDAISHTVTSLAAKIADGIRTEALIAIVLICIYVFIVLIAVIRALTLWFGRDKTRGEGGVADAYNIPRDPQPGAPAGVYHTDTRDGFNDIPLGAVRTPTTPPKYEAHQSGETFPMSRVGGVSDEADYQDSKLGFGMAGQRPYEDGLRREATTGGRPRASHHAEVWDEKR